MTEPDKPANDESAAPAGGEREELAEAYERFAKRTKEFFEEASERSSTWLSAAMDRAREEMEAAGEFSREEGRRLQEYLRRDLATTGVDLDNLRAKAGEYLHPSRLGAGFLDLASHMIEGASGLLEELGKRSDAALAYRTGEITGPGTLTCSKCGEELHYKKSGRIPPCPKCKGSQYRKRY